MTMHPSRGWGSARYASLLAALVLTACSNPSANTPVNVAGNWTLSLKIFAGDGISCDATGITLQLEQGDVLASISGRWDGGTYSCIGPDGNLAFAGTNGYITGLVMSGGSVSLLLHSFPEEGVLNAELDGTASYRSSMSGQGTAHINFGGTTGVVTLSGAWEATFAAP